MQRQLPKIPTLVPEVINYNSLLIKAIQEKNYGRALHYITNPNPNRNADVNHKDKEGKSPLYYALLDYAMLKILLENGANPDQILFNGITGLYWAVLAGKLLMAKLFLEHGADPNLIINHRYPALFAAIDRHDVSMIELLLNWHANPNLTLANGTNALKLAAKVPTKESIVELLLTHGLQLQLKLENENQIENPDLKTEEKTVRKPKPLSTSQDFELFYVNKDENIHVHVVILNCKQFKIIQDPTRGIIHQYDGKLRVNDVTITEPFIPNQNFEIKQTRSLTLKPQDKRPLKERTPHKFTFSILAIEKSLERSKKQKERTQLNPSLERLKQKNQKNLNASLERLKQLKQKSQTSLSKETKTTATSKIPTLSLLKPKVTKTPVPSQTPTFPLIKPVRVNPSNNSLRKQVLENNLFKRNTNTNLERLHAGLPVFRR